MTDGLFNTVALEEVQNAFSRLRFIKEKFAEKGWFPATSGNLSIRLKGVSNQDQLIIAVTSSGKDKSIQTTEDFLIVDSEGKPIGETKLKPSAETLIHTALYNLFPKCEAVFHVHTIANNLISELYFEQKEITFKHHELIKALDIWDPVGSITIPIVENEPHIPSLANKIKKRLNSEMPGILILNHGIYVWGDSDFSAQRYLEALEFLFDYHIKLLLLKKIKKGD